MNDFQNFEALRGHNRAPGQAEAFELNRFESFQNSGGEVFIPRDADPSSTINISEVRRNLIEIGGQQAAIASTELPGIPIPWTAEQNSSKARLPKFTTRSVSLNDLDSLVDLDIEAFRSVYDEYDMSREELRDDLRIKFNNRLTKLESDWTTVVEMDGELCGFIMSCPTSKKPEDFESWEKTTDEGTLDTTYDPNGDYIYIVSLTMPRPGCGESPKNMLVVDRIGKLAQSQAKCVYFESRMPGLRDWVSEKFQGQPHKVDSLPEDELQALAEEYKESTVIKNGKEVMRDPHLRMYKSIGCRFVKVAADAYQDGPSMNFGVVTVYDNPLPKALQGNRAASIAAGGLIRSAGRSHKLVKRFF